MYKIIIEIILGLIFADLFAGFFHWFEDTYLDYCINIPILHQIAKDNELHHYFPRAIVHYEYYEHMIVVTIISAITIGIFFAINYKFVLRHVPFFVSLFIFTSLSNVFHRFSHMRDCELPNIIRFLQKFIIVSHEHHAIHHAKSPDTKYCVIMPYNNYWLDNLQLWRMLESVIYIAFGVKASRKKKYSDYSVIHNEIHENNKKECPRRPTDKDIKALESNLENMYQCYLK